MLLLGGPGSPCLDYQQSHCPEMAQTKGPNCSYSMRIRTSCSQWPQAKGSNCGLALPPETSAQPLLSTKSSGPALWEKLALVMLPPQLYQGLMLPHI